MSLVVVIGAGPMGLAAAYQALKGGHRVQLFEAGPIAGGMAAHFDFDGLSLERFYHFVCRGDDPTFELMKELGIGDKLRWVPTSMGLFLNGALHPWGNPLALLRFPGIGLLTKLRYGLLGIACTLRKSWPELEHITARDWLVRWCGQEGYDQLWRPLFELKFYEHANTVSAAWLWARMRRAWRSRSSLMQEELGYIEGGSATLIDALVASIHYRGGCIHLNSPVSKIVVEQGQALGVDTPAGFFPADHVISTIPLPQVPRMVPDLPADLEVRYRSIESVGICCVILKLQRPVSPHFWVNLSGVPHDVPGIIEFSNLRPVGNHIVYVPYYMPPNNEKFLWTDHQFINDAFACVSMLNPSLNRTDLLNAKVSRLRYAQAVCPPGFAARLPPVHTPIIGLQIADTSSYYPEDRSIAESAHLGRKMAERLGAGVEPSKLSEDAAFVEL
jgi:protoporphyrinogen oxidase